MKDLSEMSPQELRQRRSLLRQRLRRGECPEDFRETTEREIGQINALLAQEGIMA